MGSKILKLKVFKSVTKALDTMKMYCLLVNNLMFPNTVQMFFSSTAINNKLNDIFTL